MFIEFLGAPGCGKSTICQALAKNDRDYLDVSQLISMPVSKPSLSKFYIKQLILYILKHPQPERIINAEIRYCLNRASYASRCIDLLISSSCSPGEKMRRVREFSKYIAVVQAVQEHSSVNEKSKVLFDEGSMKVLGPSLLDVSSGLSNLGNLILSDMSYILVDSPSEIIFERYIGRGRQVSAFRDLDSKELKAKIERSQSSWVRVADFIKAQGGRVVVLDGTEPVSKNVQIIKHELGGIRH